MSEQTTTEIHNVDLSKTLANRLSEGRLPVTEALRYAMILAEALRKLHDEGRAHGAIAPGNLALTAAGLDLQAARLTSDHTSYAAPEVLDGRPADSRSDIFSFGCVLYEMLTGRPPYDGRDRTPPVPTGSPAVDRLLGSCMAYEPAARCQRMQKVILELKLLSVAAARAGAPPAARREAAADVMRAEMGMLEARLNARLLSEEKRSAELIRMVTEALTHVPDEKGDLNAALLEMESRVAARFQSVDKKMGELQRTAAEARYREPAEPTVTTSQLQEVEARLAARLQNTEQAFAEMQRVAGEALNTLRDQLATVVSHLSTAQDRAALAEQNIASLEQKLAAVESRPHTVETGRVEAIETNVEALRKQTTELRDLVAEDMLSFEHSLKSQASAIESARTAMAQTDDLVERVVEALESLQSSVLDHPEERSMAAG